MNPHTAAVIIVLFYHLDNATRGGRRQERGLYPRHWSLSCLMTQQLLLIARSRLDTSAIRSTSVPQHESS